MSTYLVAFVVSNYKYANASNQFVYARPQYIDEGRAQYALGNSKPLLDFMGDYTGIPYTLKMAQVAIPDKYFDLGAMENWAIVTYK